MTLYLEVTLPTSAWLADLGTVLAVKKGTRACYQFAADSLFLIGGKFIMLYIHICI